ncbi:MAG: hypothetical protein L6R41_006228 [Letrouitia leprolyta]|nr:MAG: hypothetical protein L6R41_006228 [Letrouitia leprolyta]
MDANQPPSISVKPDEDEATEKASSSDEDSPVELLVTGREKRTTAGNRMSTLLDREGDDELELLFAEDEQEEDDEFEEEDDEDGSDIQLDSASSDEDQGPAKEDDDLEGEKELVRQTRDERQKKRKAQDAFLKPGVLKKRIRVTARPGSTETPTTPAPRPKKKSERVSWLPTKDEGPVRASSRKQTVMNKEVVHSRLAASEKRRIHQLQIMEEAAKRKAVSKPKPMTQAQHMEEAARTERSNAKSLNRWEAAEKKRLEEQKAKLEALHNRQLTGPVITWWSGMARWLNGKLAQVGWKSIKEAEIKVARHAQQNQDPPIAEVSSTSQQQAIDHQNSVLNNDELIPPSQAVTLEPNVPLQSDTVIAAQKTTVISPQDVEGFLDGIHYYASLPEQSSDTAASERPHKYERTEASPKPPESSTLPLLALEATPTKIPPRVSQSEDPNIQLSGRNVIILEDIDANVQRVSELQDHVLMKKKSNNKGPSKSPSFDPFPHFRYRPVDLGV